MNAPANQNEEQTLSMIKPDAVAQNMIGNVLECFEREGLKIVAMKMVHLTDERAQAFYAVHKERPFYQELVSFMTSGPIVAIVLQGENAIARTRQIMGSTDPAKAEPGTIRAEFATSIDRNAVHGSDSPLTAMEEIPFFFQPEEIFTNRE